MRACRQKKDSIYSQKLQNAELDHGSNSESLLLAIRKMNSPTELSSNTEVMSSLSPNIFKRKAQGAVEEFKFQGENKQLPWLLTNLRFSH